MKRYLRVELAILFLFMGFSSCKISRFIVYNFADITDHKIFPEREISKAETSFQFPHSKKKKTPSNITAGEESMAFDAFLEKNKTVGFIIIQNDSIQYESYTNGYDESSIVPSFSMAKSICSILIGCAIDDKLIASVDEPIINYIPELKENGFEEVTIKHVLQMTSGIKFNESYFNPFGDAANFYYGRNLRKAISKMKLKNGPGRTFEYVSGSSQLLGLVLERALEDKSITAYLEEKLWIPLGMEYDASWSIDRKKDGLEKTFCCINARARDFAKIGRLFLNKGNWNGKQIVSEDWVKQSTAVDYKEGSVAYYQYQWWLPTTTGDYMAQGLLGQYIYVNPQKDIIIVRLGKKEGDTDWWSVLVALANSY